MKKKKIQVPVTLSVYRYNGKPISVDVVVSMEHDAHHELDPYNFWDERKDFLKIINRKLKSKKLKITEKESLVEFKNGLESLNNIVLHGEARYLPTIDFLEHNIEHVIVDLI